MHASALLHSWLGQWLSCIHSTRLVALFDMVAACVAGAGLSITSVERRLPGPTTLKHKIKRADRLIGNPHLYGERTAIYPPERLAGHMKTADFVPFWGEGEDNFKSNPPNAHLSVLEGDEMANTVLELREPRLAVRDLSYAVKVLEGQPPASGGPASLFIDIIGRAADTRLLCRRAAAHVAALTADPWRDRPGPRRTSLERATNIRAGPDSLTTYEYRQDCYGVASPQAEPQFPGTGIARCHPSNIACRSRS